MCLCGVGGEVRFRGQRFAGTTLLLMALAGVFAGCGGGGKEAPGTSAKDARAYETERYKAAIGETFRLLETVDMRLWADYGRMLYAQGQIQVVDFSAPHKNPWGASGLDGAADIENQMVYLDQTVCVSMPPRHLTIVMLDELAHLYYRTPGHEQFDRLHAQFIRLWEARFGRPFNSLGPEDTPYQQWWDAFLARHSRAPEQPAGLVSTHQLASGTK